MTPLAVATMLKAKRKLKEALGWVDRGLAVEKQHPRSPSRCAMSLYDLGEVGAGPVAVRTRPGPRPSASLNGSLVAAAGRAARLRPR